jgi:UDPglucose 6-dehydrogenase/GDP-mannose 6-dehydrogenase
MMRVSVIGAGYVGLVAAACLAEKGHSVVCVDVDESKVQKICRGISPMFEAGLDRLLQENVGTNLWATTDLHASVIHSEMTLVAVGTPFDGREIDLRFIKEVSRQIGKALRDKRTYHLVVVKSTVVPGTTDDVVTPILEEASGKKVGVDFGVAVNPEFLTQGQAVEDFMFPDRIVLGGNDDHSISMLEQLYSAFQGVPKVHTNNKTAEMIKYTSNAMLATSISFANEIGNLCSALGGVDVVDVMKGVHLSKYLRPRSSTGEHVQAPLSSFFEAGCGFGGSCLPKDVKALIAHGEKAGLQMPLLCAVIKINEQQPKRMLEILKRSFPSLRGVRVAVLGLAFKPDTDDIRESPAITIIRHLLAEGATILAYDPVAIPEARKILDFQDVRFQNSLSESVKDVEAIVLVTRWKEFEKLPGMLREAKTQPIVVDGRRMLDKDSIVNYAGIGL